MAYFKWTSEYRALVKRLYEQGMDTRQVIDYFFDNYGLNVSRQLGTVKPNDKYEIMNGWTLSKKELYALEYDSDKLVAEWHV